MKLLMTADSVGGVWQYATELSGALAARDVTVTLATLGDPLDAGQRAAVPGGVALIETGLPVDWLTDAAGARAAGAGIARLARRIDADLVHLNSPTLAAVPMPCPAIAVAHGCVATWWEQRGTALDPSFAWHRELMREGLTRADRVVAPTLAHAEALRRVYRLPARPVIVPNGRSAPAPVDHALHDAAVTVGRLWDEVKNAAWLDRVAGRMAAPFAAIGPLRGPRGEQVALSHLISAGERDARGVAATTAGRVFVSAASFEPFGLAVLEAAQLGCPLVLSDIAGFCELWDGVALFLPLGDESRWAAAIDGLIADRPRRDALGDAARRRAGRYTPAAMANGMIALYLPAREARAAA